MSPGFEEKKTSDTVLSAYQSWYCSIFWRYLTGLGFSVLVWTDYLSKFPQNKIHLFHAWPWEDSKSAWPVLGKCWKITLIRGSGKQDSEQSKQQFLSWIGTVLGPNTTLILPVATWALNNPGTFFFIFFWLPCWLCCIVIYCWRFMWESLTLLRWEPILCSPELAVEIAAIWWLLLL